MYQRPGREQPSPSAVAADFAYTGRIPPADAKGPTMFDLASVQTALRGLGLDGWLLYDFRGLNVLARRVLALPAGAILSRRWFYFIPAAVEPRKLLHRIEPHALDHLPGRPRL